jgi:hypothetical protein
MGRCASISPHLSTGCSASWTRSLQKHQCLQNQGRSSQPALGEQACFRVSAALKGQLKRVSLPDRYVDQIARMLGDVELSDQRGSDKKLGKLKSCAELASDSKDWFNWAITNHPDCFK